jgi:hypothetical protein
MAAMTRRQHRAEAKRILKLADEQTKSLDEPNLWTVPYLLMAQVHATLSLERSGLERAMDGEV